VTKKKLFVLDVSGFIFRAYFALPPLNNSSGEATHALFGFIRSILKLYKDFQPHHLVAVYDGPENKKQRQELYEAYKAHRVREYEDLPEQIERAKEFCTLMGIPQVEIPGVEADDVMGSIAVWATSLPDTEVYLCTSDKDLCQLVNDRVFILNPWKENLIIDSAKVEEIYGVPPAQIVDLLAIVGDSSDNIPGLPGFGPKTALPLLKEWGSLENLLAHAEEVKGAKKQETLRNEGEMAKLSKRLATIYTDTPFSQDPLFFAIGKPQTAELKAFYIEMGFSLLARELDPLLHTEENTAYHLVDTPLALHQLVQKLKQAEEIAFDVETTSLRPLLANLVGIGFSIRQGEGYYVPLNGELGKNAVLDALKPLFEDPALKFIGHNIKYDLHVLANVGIHVAHVTFDTILASYLLNSSSRRHSLDHLALNYFGKVKTPIKELIGTGKKEITMDLVPITRVCDYCCQDVDYTLRIKHILAPQLNTRGLDALLFDLELPLSAVLLKMERKGMFVDTSLLQIISNDIAKELKQTEQKIFALAGEEFNINSPKQLSGILFEKLKIKPLKKTATGYSTNADVLEALAKEHPIAEKLLVFRTLEKLRSTYLESLPQEINPHTGRIHPTFNQFVAATGRLACQDPNLQNIPVRTAQGKRLREAFRPQQTGWSYLSADYSQIELRLLAHLSDDERLIQAFEEGEDIHAYTASLVFGIPLRQVTPLQRHQAKAINFGIVYGQQAYGLSQQLNIDTKEALAFIENYFFRYPKVLTFINHCIATARKEGKAVTMIGREREIPEINSSNAILRNTAERLAINTPLQGSAADLIKLAMLKIDALLIKSNMRTQMVLQIHDELIFEAPNEEMESLIPLVKEGMEKVFTLKIPLVVDVNIGKNWAEC
jgi:DNA polymerase I